MPKRKRFLWRAMKSAKRQLRWKTTSFSKESLQKTAGQEHPSIHPFSIPVLFPIPGSSGVYPCRPGTVYEYRICGDKKDSQERPGNFRKEGLLCSACCRGSRMQLPVQHKTQTTHRLDPASDHRFPMKLPGNHKTTISQ